MALSKFEIDVRAKTTALSLRVRLRGASSLRSSPDAGCTAHRVSSSLRAWIVSVGLTLLQVLAPQSTRATVRCSLRVRLRKLWLRIRGKHHHHVESARTHQKPKWRRTLSSVCNQLLLRNKSSSEKITNVVSQDPENESMVKYMDAFGADTVVMAMHGVGMVSTLIVLVQLAGATGLPLFVIVVTGLAIAGRIIFLDGHLSSFEQLWQEAMSIGGISMVPQALGAIFRPYLPQSGFTTSEGVMATIALIMVLLAKCQRLPFKAMQFFGVLSRGIPAILVLWAPAVQLWNCWWSPADVNFMQILTGLVAVVSNCFLGYSRNGKYTSTLLSTM